MLLYRCPGREKKKGPVLLEESGKRAEKRGTKYFYQLSNFFQGGGGFFFSKGGRNGKKNVVSLKWFSRGLYHHSGRGGEENLVQRGKLSGRRICFSPTKKKRKKREHRLGYFAGEGRGKKGGRGSPTLGSLSFQKLSCLFYI